MVLILVVVLVIFLGFFGSIDWLAHRDMVKSSTNQYGVSNYKKFIEEFHKVEWEHQKLFTSSLFGKDRKDQFHANIIEFNGRGMIINNPISYLLVKLYVKKYIKNTFQIKRKISEWR